MPHPLKSSNSQIPHDQIGNSVPWTCKSIKKEDMLRARFNCGSGVVATLIALAAGMAHELLVGGHAAAVLGVCMISGSPASFELRLRGKFSWPRRSRPLAALKLRAELANERPDFERMKTGGGSSDCGISA